MRGQECVRNGHQQRGRRQVWMYVTDWVYKDKLRYTPTHLLETCFALSADLNQFPTDEREPVNVKEGQGAVLLCSPPSRYPSKICLPRVHKCVPGLRK